ncbi:MAG: hypothetical protein IJ685_09115 [Selenomonadaceae bacterium]|nr:hypothetical protein [Selenomonadaceae bacterium]
MNTKTKPVEQWTINDVILSEVRQLRTEVSAVRTDLKETSDELNNRMNHIENEMRSPSRHTQIMTTSVVGIALAVVYFVFTH